MSQELDCLKKEIEMSKLRDTFYVSEKMRKTLAKLYLFLSSVRHDPLPLSEQNWSYNLQSRCLYQPFSTALQNWTRQHPRSQLFLTAFCSNEARLSPGTNSQRLRSPHSSNDYRAHRACAGYQKSSATSPKNIYILNESRIQRSIRHSRAVLQTVAKLPFPFSSRCKRGIIAISRDLANVVSNKGTFDEIHRLFPRRR